MSCVFFAWFGLAANFTVIGSEAPGGFWPLRFLTASSASARLSNRIKATPRDPPGYERAVVDSLFCYKQHNDGFFVKQRLYLLFEENV